VHYTPQGDKARLLETYLKDHPGEQALVFGRTKHGSEKLMKLLVSWGFKAGSIHGNKSQNQRDRTLTEFRNAELDVLVATDVAARGIDIPGVRHVYNYDLPNVPENYVHRIGRTARAGAEGRAIAFCAPAEMGELKDIEKLLKKTLPIKGGAPWAISDIKAAPKPPQRGQRPAKPGGQSNGKPGVRHASAGKPNAGKPSSGKPMRGVEGGNVAPKKQDRRSGGGKPQGRFTAA
jgi:ATP-dependent RNA helicase RhlE